MTRPPFLMRLAYSVALTASWPLARLYYALRTRTDGKYRTNHRARLGLELPPNLPGNRPRIWVHALSVGETASCASLVRELRNGAPEVEIIFSSATETGRRTAEERLGAWVDSFFFLPHDYPFAVRAVIERVKPSAFVLVETDIWLNLLSELAAGNIPAILVNGRLSPRSHARLLRLSSLARPLFGLFDAIFAQSETDRLRFASLGIPEHKLHAVGNIKFDAALPSGADGGFPAPRPDEGMRERTVWIGGSTHPGEEEILLQAHRLLMETLDHPLLILAPRDIRRGEALERLCGAAGFTAAVRSRGESADGRDVFILDTLGELKGFYGAADAAFIGGSLVPFGGHNPLEATAVGVPTCWGPHLFNFREIEAGLLEEGAGVRIPSADDLATTLARWLSDTPERRRIEVACRHFISKNLGASAAVARFVVRRISGRPGS